LQQAFLASTARHWLGSGTGECGFITFINMKWKSTPSGIVLTLFTTTTISLFCRTQVVFAGKAFRRFAEKDVLGECVDCGTALMVTPTHIEPWQFFGYYGL
jgi:hypothetical protein